jgi:hypothetical protein
MLPLPASDAQRPGRLQFLPGPPLWVEIVPVSSQPARRRCARLGRQGIKFRQFNSLSQIMKAESAILAYRPWRPGLALLLSALLGAASVQADPAVEAGTRLAQAVYDRPAGADVAIRATMTLTEQGHEPRRRELFTYRADRGGAERWSLTRFTAPADIQGVGLLTLDHPGDESDQWLYLPALDRVRRVSSSRKGGRFVGSDLFFEDLRDREVDMDQHRLEGKDKVGSLACDVLVSTPRDPDNSVYSKRVGCVHPGTLIALRVDLYQAHASKPVKRLSVKRIKKIQGFWTVTDSVMQDLDTGHETRITAEAVKYNQGIPDRLFSAKVLSDDSAELPYRP